LKNKQKHPQLPAMLAAIDAVVASLATGHDLRSARLAAKKPALPDVVYEAYLYTEVVNACRATMGVVPKSIPGGIFSFRRAPGKLKARSPYSWVELAAPNGKYELHVDLRVETTTLRVPLEFDIVGIEAAAAQACRATKKASLPHSTTAGLLIEAKFHAGGTGMAEAKGYLGAMSCMSKRTRVESFVCSESMTLNAQALLTSGAAPTGALTVHCDVSTAKAGSVTGFGRSIAAEIATKL
jgi:hypothetical protein